MFLAPHSHIKTAQCQRLIELLEKLRYTYDYQRSTLRRYLFNPDPEKMERNLERPYRKPSVAEQQIIEYNSPALGLAGLHI